MMDQIGCTPSTKIKVVSEDSSLIRSKRANSSRYQTQVGSRATASAVPILTTIASQRHSAYLCPARSF